MDARRHISLIHSIRGNFDLGGFCPRWDFVLYPVKKEDFDLRRLCPGGLCTFALSFSEVYQLCVAVFIVYQLVK